MKRSIVILSALAFIFSACENDRMLSDSVKVNQDLTFTASFADSDSGGTKTSLQESGSVWWSPGDAISLFYGSGSGGGSKFTAQTTVPVGVTNFSGSIGVITGGGEISLDDTWFWATYPYNSSASCDGSSITTVLPSEQFGKAGTFSDNTFITIARSQGLILSFYNVCSGLKFSVTNSNVRKVSIKSNGGEKIAGTATIKFNESGVPYVVGVTDGSDEVTVCAPDNGCFEVGESYYIVMLPQVLSSGFTVTMETADKYATREITKSAEFKRSVFNKMMDADKTVEYSTKPSEYEYVDLGLSVLWATCNVGASEPEDCGDYFAWGETEKKDCYDWSTYKFCNKSISEYELKFYKYCTDIAYGSTESYFIEYYNNHDISYDDFGNPIPFTDGKKVLDPEDDVAHVNWGGNWRMPTATEWGELQNSNNCTWTYTTLNGVNGYRVTSRIEGYTDNSIFIPCAGIKWDDYLYHTEDGHYWSSSLTYGNRQANNCSFGSDFVNDALLSSGNERCDGLSVRPVCPSSSFVPATGVSLSETSLSLIVGDNVTLAATIAPSTATNKSVSWSSSNTAVATVDASGNVKAVKAGTATIIVETANGGYSASCSVMVTSGSGSSHEYVDLGLSVKWATCNVGASKPEDYGDYFAWGETEPYYQPGYAQEDPQSHWKSGKSSGYGWSTYKYCKGSYDTMTKYCTNSSYGYNGFTDSKTVLDPEDDAAHVNWCGDWRMPTKDEFYELRNSSNCTWTWTTMNGVDGYKVVSKKSGYEGNYIFLPAVGYRYGTDLDGVGSIGRYWSSSLYTDNPYHAYDLYFHSGYYSTYDLNRYFGISVRPVCN